MSGQLSRPAWPGGNQEGVPKGRRGRGGQEEPPGPTGFFPPLPPDLCEPSFRQAFTPPLPRNPPWFPLRATLELRSQVALNDRASARILGRSLIRPRHPCFETAPFPPVPSLAHFSFRTTARAQGDHRRPGHCWLQDRGQVRHHLRGHRERRPDAPRPHRPDSNAAPSVVSAAPFHATPHDTASCPMGPSS